MVSSDFSSPHRHFPIGVFDSGVGGLTVLRALRDRLPAESFVYLGDTARLPYGTKSPDSVRRYSLQASQFLVSRGIKCLVVACNTASAMALPLLRERLSPIPVIGVIEPGAAAGCGASRSGRIAVIATEGTVAGGAYQEAIARMRAGAQVQARACTLFVALAEEGWTEGEIAETVARRYLEDLFATPARAPDTLVLGCTHFPVLLGALRRVVGPEVTIVDSAATTAAAVAAELAELQLAASGIAPGRLTLMATDGAARFARVGSRFLGEPFAADDVELVDL
ncbi:MAG: glutamate racemase [Proteobacteria bacterium]|nr:MAG: glutamate racemase [Pseudomonadota bacterium]